MQQHRCQTEQIKKRSAVFDHGEHTRPTAARMLRGRESRGDCGGLAVFGLPHKPRHSIGGKCGLVPYTYTRTHSLSSKVGHFVPKN